MNSYLLSQKLALQSTLHIKQAEAEQKRVLSTQQQQTDAEIGQIQAEAKVKRAKLEAESLQISTDADVYSQRERAKVLENSPQAMLMSFLREFSQALTNGHFSSALPLTDLSNMMSNFMSQISQMINKKPVVIEGGSASPAFFQIPRAAESSNDQLELQVKQ